MAENKRELITRSLVATLQGVESLTKVTRKKVTKVEFDAIPATQLPYVSVMSSLPDPQEIKFSKRQYGRIDKIHSELTTTITVFGLDNVTPDETISALLQDIWIAVFADYTRGGHALQTTIKPQVETGILDPYYSFELEVLTKYSHDTTHI